MAADEDIENDDKDRLLPNLSAIDDKQGKQKSKLMTYIQCCKYKCNMKLLFAMISSHISLIYASYVLRVHLFKLINFFNLSLFGEYLTKIVKAIYSFQCYG